MNKKQTVTIVHDNNIYDRSYIEITKRYHDINVVDVKSLSAKDFKQSLLFILQVDLTNPKTILALKEKMSTTEGAKMPTLFLLNDFTRREIVQASILGASDYIAYPCPDDYFITIIGNLTSQAVEKAWEKLSHIQEMALKVSLKTMEDTFKNAITGNDISQEDIKHSCDMIIQATEKDGLTDWMNAIRLHHNYTYRHSMMVCGYLVSFGLHLGVKNTDLQLLSLGGVMHDIGKSLVPLHLLDKPAKLTSEEWVIMKQHPGNAQGIMKEGEWDPLLIDMATHHHEKLDGDGYPHGLKGSEISDLTRMTAIADVFSGLTDKRSYKAAMSAEKAINIMLSMSGHLDIDLVKAFQPIVIT